MLRIIFTALLLLLVTACEQAEPDLDPSLKALQKNTTMRSIDGDLHIYVSYGGRLKDWSNATDYVISSKTKVILHTYCFSACTVFLDRIAEADPTKVCVHPAAELGFHKISTNVGGSVRYWPTEHWYSESIMEWINSKGGLPEGNLLMMYGDDLLNHFTACE